VGFFAWGDWGLGRGGWGGGGGGVGAVGMVVVVGGCRGVVCWGFGMGFGCGRSWSYGLNYARSLRLHSGFG